MDVPHATLSRHEQAIEEISPTESTCSKDGYQLCGSCTLSGFDKVEHSRLGKVARVTFDHVGHGEDRCENMRSAIVTRRQLYTGLPRNVHFAKWMFLTLPYRATNRLLRKSPQLNQPAQKTVISYVVEHSRLGKVARVTFDHVGHGEDSEDRCYGWYVGSVHRYRHPNVVCVFGTDGQPAATGLFSEYPDGGDFGQYAKRHDVSWTDLLLITEDILKGLVFLEWVSGYIWPLNIAIQPANVWMFGGTAKVAFCGFPCTRAPDAANKLHSLSSFGSTLNTMAMTVKASSGSDRAHDQQVSCPYVLEQIIEICCRPTASQNNAPSFSDFLNELRRHHPPKFYCAWDVTLQNRTADLDPDYTFDWHPNGNKKVLTARDKWFVAKKGVYGPRSHHPVFESEDIQSNPTDGTGSRQISPNGVNNSTVTSGGSGLCKEQSTCMTNESYKDLQCELSPLNGSCCYKNALREACLSESDREEDPSTDSDVSTSKGRVLDKGYCYKNGDCDTDFEQYIQNCDHEVELKAEFGPFSSESGEECEDPSLSDENDSDSVDNYSEHYNMHRLCDDSFLNDQNTQRSVVACRTSGCLSETEVEEYGSPGYAEQEESCGSIHLGYDDDSSENSDNVSDSCDDAVSANPPVGDSLTFVRNSEAIDASVIEEDKVRPSISVYKHPSQSPHRHRLGEYRDLHATERLKDIRTDILILLKDLDHILGCLPGHSCLKDFRSCALRNLERTEFGCMRQSTFVSDKDLNVKPFPVPKQVRVDPSSLRPWLEKCEPLDTSLPDSGYAWGPPVVYEDDLSSASNNDEPWYGDWTPFDTSIEGEAAWNTLPGNIIEDDHPTDQQLDTITDRQKRLHFREEHSMARRRERLAEYFIVKYNVKRGLMDTYLGFASRLDESEKALEDLVEMDFCFIIK